MPSGEMSVPGAVRGLLTIEGLLDCYQWKRQTVLLHTDWQHKEFRIACSEQEYRAPAWPMGCSNSSFPTKSWACAYTAFLTGIISWSVGSVIQKMAIENKRLFPTLLPADDGVIYTCVVKEISFCSVYHFLFYVLVNVVSVLTEWNN